VIGGLGSVFGPLLGALVFLGLEEALKGVTEHWMVIFGPLIVLVALLGKRGIVGLLEHFDARAPVNVSTTVPIAENAAIDATSTARKTT
jgi:branched-chain amino acid transport system permease protein